MTSENGKSPFNDQDDGKGGDLLIPDPEITFPIRVVLDDQGQDLLELLIGHAGIVIDSNAQRDVWVGLEVHTGHLIETYEAHPGEGCIICRRDASEDGSLLKYRAVQLYQRFPRETLHVQ